MNARPIATLGSLLGLGLALGVLVPACGGAVSTLSSKICDCEHCNDFAEEILSDQLDGEEKIAKDYGCDSQFSDWIDCQNNNGLCNDQKASFSTKLPGHCNGPVQNTQQACKIDADCMQQQTSCLNGTCQFKTCSGTMQGGGSCKTDSDCPGGTDQCDTQSTALQSCIENASADKKNDFNVGTD